MRKLKMVIDPEPKVEEMTQAEAIETLVRTDETHLSADDEPVRRAELPVQQGIKSQKNKIGMLHALSQIDDGINVAWDTCARCKTTLSYCTCSTPQEPPYITRWREEYLARTTQVEQTIEAIDGVITEGVAEALDEALEAVTEAEEAKHE